MQKSIFLAILFFAFVSSISAQEERPIEPCNKHEIVWSAGLFKSWLKDEYVGFNKIGDKVTPVFSEEKKTGFSFKSHYMYKPSKWVGIGAHLGIGLDVYSYIEAPVVLFGVSVSFGNNHQFIIDFGLADGKRKIIPDGLKVEIETSNYIDIPVIYEQTELNTGYYLGISYRLF